LLTPKTPFARWLAGAVVLGLGVRLVYALAVMGSRPVSGDGSEFHLLANVLATAHRYVEPFLYAFRGGRVVPTAEKPPLYPALLALPSAIGLDSFTAHRIASCVMGTALVALVGLLGRRVAGNRAGVLAAFVAALYPALWMLDASLRSESLYAPLVALCLLAAYRLRDAPSARRAALLGGTIGLAALTRSEGQLFLVVLALPVVWVAQPAPRLRLRLAVAGLGGFLVLVGPWLARNWIAFARPTAISTNEGGLLAGSNCHSAYYTKEIGTWACLPVNDPRWGTNEAAISGHLRERAVDYASDHTGRLAAVVAVRVLRVWDLWHPRGSAHFEAAIANRALGAQQAAVVCLYLLAPLAAIGCVVLRRRGGPLRILLAPVALVTFVAATTYGSTRFRVAAEPAIVTLSAVALDAAWVRAPQWRRKQAVAA